MAELLEALPPRIEQEYMAPLVVLRTDNFDGNTPIGQRADAVGLNRMGAEAFRDGVEFPLAVVQFQQVVGGREPQTTSAVFGDSMHSQIELPNGSRGPPQGRCTAGDAIGGAEPKNASGVAKNIVNVARENPRPADHGFTAAGKLEQRIAIENPDAVIGSSPTVEILMGSAIDDVPPRTIPAGYHSGCAPASKPATNSSPFPPT